MAITESTDNPKLIYHGTLEVPSGKTIRFETSPNGVEIIDVDVPEGKTYNLQVHVVITQNGE